MGTLHNVDPKYVSIIFQTPSVDSTLNIKLRTLNQPPKYRKSRGEYKPGLINGVKRKQLQISDQNSGMFPVA